MPVTMHWDNDEKTIFVMRYVGNWTWDEMFAAMRAGDIELDQIDHTCDVIHDWSESRGFPSHALSNAKSLMPRIHPNTRLHVHIGANSFFMSLWRILIKLYEPIAQKKRYIFADTMAEAREKLKGHATT